MRRSDATGKNNFIYSYSTYTVVTKSFITIKKFLQLIFNFITSFQIFMFYVFT